MNELLQMAQEGRLTKETLVWKEGMRQWEAAGNIQELVTLFQTVSNHPQTAKTRTQYNVAINGISSGPYTLEELKPFIEKGQLTKETLIWKEDVAQWVVASVVPEIVALIPQPANTSAGKFFILVEGQPSGPLSIDDLRQQIEKRQFIRSSLVWKEGMQQWAPAETIPELTNIFPVIPPPPPPQIAPSIRYYIAVNGYPDGPFTTDEVKQKFQSGQISQSTLVWKEDMPQWVAIGNIPELGALFTTTGTPPSFMASQAAQKGSPQQIASPVRYHIAVNGLSTGPFTVEELKQKVRLGQLTRNTQVWKSGMTQWELAGTVAELQSLF
jgi:hypothetical protein